MIQHAAAFSIGIAIGDRTDRVIGHRACLLDLVPAAPHRPPRPRAPSGSATRVGVALAERRSAERWRLPLASAVAQNAGALNHSGLRLAPWPRAAFSQLTLPSVGYWILLPPDAASIGSPVGRSSIGAQPSKDPKIQSRVTHSACLTLRASRPGAASLTPCPLPLPARLPVYLIPYLLRAGPDSALWGAVCFLIRCRHYSCYLLMSLVLIRQSLVMFCQVAGGFC